MKKITSCCLLGFLITALSPSAATAWMTFEPFWRQHDAYLGGDEPH